MLMRWRILAAILLAAGLFATVSIGPAAEQKETLRFSEMSQAAGLNTELRCGSAEKRWIPEANGSGAAWLDYDNDGLMDLLIVNGSDMQNLRSRVSGGAQVASGPGVSLFHNLGNGRFEDVTKRSGLIDLDWGTGANAADFDNDGFTDILITNIGVDLLYRNNGDGTFTDISKAAGLGQTVAWHTGSAFGDIDNDGKLDLYIAGYIDLHALPLKEPAPVCSYRGIEGFCGPIGIKPQAGILYRNQGNGTFTDVTQRAGLSRAKPSHSFTAVFDDFNQDGKIDLFVANDSDPNFLFLNQGDGTFREAALERGVAVSGDGAVQANMGVAVAAAGAKGRPAILTTTFADDYFPLFEQDEAGFFEDTSSAARLTAITHEWLGWACGFADFTNSGQPELWLANGHVYPKAKQYFQPVTVLRRRGGSFSAVYQYPGKPANSYRGGASADFDNDGKVDLLVLPIAGRPVLLHNETQAANRWIGLHLIGSRSNRDAIGASVQVDFCGTSSFDHVRNGGSYLSRNDPRLHFGLGTCSQVDRVRIRWPAGTVQVVDSPPVNRYLTVREAPGR